MKTPTESPWLKFLSVAGAGLFLLLSMRTTVWGQTAPTLSIKNFGTNQFSITITNNIGALDYDLQWTPVLADTNFPWTFAAIGVPGGTNFLLNANPFTGNFFRAILDTNAVPLWEQSDPNNPASPALQVFIYSPANGANLTQ